MSSEKFTKNKKNLDDPIIQRVLQAFEATELSVIARHYGKTSQNINGYISRGTFIRLVTPEIKKRNISMDWIKTGEGEMFLQSAISINRHPDDGMPLIGMADIVLHSNTIYGEALKKNIEAFYSAVLEKKKVGKEPSGSSPDIPPDAAGNVG